MGAAFHRGLTHELRYRVQLTGLRIEEIDAQRALAGYRLLNSEAQTWVNDAVSRILEPPLNGELMKSWEEDHHNEDPFPPTFAEAVLYELSNIDMSAPEATIIKLIAAAKAELLFG